MNSVNIAFIYKEKFREFNRAFAIFALGILFTAMQTNACEPGSIVEQSSFGTLENFAGEIENVVEENKDDEVEVPSNGDCKIISEGPTDVLSVKVNGVVDSYFSFRVCQSSADGEKWLEILAKKEAGPNGRICSIVKVPDLAHKSETQNDSFIFRKTKTKIGLTIKKTIAKVKLNVENDQRVRLDAEVVRGNVFIGSKHEKLTFVFDTRSRPITVKQRLSDATEVPITVLGVVTEGKNAGTDITKIYTSGGDESAASTHVVFP